MKLLDTALGFMGINGLQLAVMAGICASLFGGGYALGRVQEAHGAVATVVKQQPAQTAAVTKAARGQIDKGNADIAAQQARQDAADKRAADLLLQRNQKLARDLATARAALEKVKSDACADDQNIVGGDALRRVLDAGAGAATDPAGSDGAEATHQAGADAAAAARAAAAPLTCGQFKAGYLNLAAWGRQGWGTVEAFQAQARALDLVPVEGVLP